MTIREIARQAACGLPGVNVASTPTRIKIADAVAVEVLREAKERLRSKLTPYASYQMAANIIDALLAECAPAAPIAAKEWACSCGARNYEDGRDICWNCKAGKPSVAPAAPPRDAAQPEPETRMPADTHRLHTGWASPPAAPPETTEPMKIGQAWVAKEKT